MHLKERTLKCLQTIKAPTMSIYTKLKIKPSDSQEVKTKKLATVANLKRLRTELGTHIETSKDPALKGGSVKIATWNIREFGGTKYKGRSFEELYYIAEIISHFDLIALQEVRKDLKEFLKLKKILGPNWSYIATDVTDGSAGNQERLVFLYNRNKVFFRNIAGELTLKENAKIRASFGERIKLENGIKVDLNSAVDLSGTYDAYTETKNGKVRLKEDLEIPLPSNCTLSIPDGASMVLKKGQEIIRPENGKATVTVPTPVIEGEKYGLRFPENSFDDSLRQFARTPFLISFQSGWLKINLCTVHIYYGSETNVNKLTQREAEIKQLTAALEKKAKSEFKLDKESFLGVLGDFNIVGKDHPTMAALESNGFEIPDALKNIPGSNVKRDKAYDQIAFWKPKYNTEYAKLSIMGANIFDFYEHIYRAQDEAHYRAEDPAKNGLKAGTAFNTWRTYKMSDHLPMWIELQTDFSEEYFEKITAQG